MLHKHSKLSKEQIVSQIGQFRTRREESNRLKGLDKRQSTNVRPCSGILHDCKDRGSVNNWSCGMSHCVGRSGTCI